MLNAQERAQVAQVWDLIAGHEAPFGAELLLRLFTVYPSTKTYFKHLGVFPDEVHLLSHGKRLLEAVGVAVLHMDNLRWALSPLADLHAHVLRVDPSNFPVRQPRPLEGLRVQPWGGGACGWSSGRDRREQTPFPPPLLPQLLIQCFQVVLASHLQGEYTVEMQAAWDKFLTGVAVVLTEKYR
ncbi:hemoglobin subunit mu [Rhinolophus ferrumequinum]|uniref:Hemoglobin subunit mu n=1 Tax=Rhinolophus ferrumequinum TaxID=59479 RepID=A0A7J7R5N7_RHIFE|nr:hemoglobin subunit mu [Rhinolophus ferrumequinum]